MRTSGVCELVNTAFRVWRGPQGCPGAGCRVLLSPACPPWASLLHSALRSGVLGVLGRRPHHRKPPGPLEVMAFLGSARPRGGHDLSTPPTALVAGVAGAGWFCAILNKLLSFRSLRTSQFRFGLPRLLSALLWLWQCRHLRCNFPSLSRTWNVSYRAAL